MERGGLAGFPGLLAAIVFAVPIAVVVGYLYALLLESVKGQEMMVGNLCRILHRCSYVYFLANGAV